MGTLGKAGNGRGPFGARRPVIGHHLPSLPIRGWECGPVLVKRDGGNKGAGDRSGATARRPHVCTYLDGTGSPVAVGMRSAGCVVRASILISPGHLAKGTQAGRSSAVVSAPAGTTAEFRFRIAQPVSLGDTCSGHGTRTRHATYPFIYPLASWGCQGGRS